MGQLESDSYSGRWWSRELLANCDEKILSGFSVFFSKC